MAWVRFSGHGMGEIEWAWHGWDGMEIAWA